MNKLSGQLCKNETKCNLDFLLVFCSSNKFEKAWSKPVMKVKFIVSHMDHFISSFYIIYSLSTKISAEKKVL